jgi:hypothetical protein
MKTRYPLPFGYGPAAGGIFLGLVLLLGNSASAQNLLKNGDFESPFPVTDPTAGWAVVFPGGADGDYTDWAIAGRTKAASRVTGGHGAHLRPNNWGTVHAYFTQVVTNLTPGAVYRLDIQKMRSNFKYTDEGGASALQKVYAAIISGTSSNAVHGYSTNNGPYSLTITCAPTRRIEVQLHNWKRYMSNESAEDMKHAKCSAWFDDVSLTLVP